jgi:hypothetical protein
MVIMLSVLFPPYKGSITYGEPSIFVGYGFVFTSPTERTINGKDCHIYSADIAAIRLAMQISTIVLLSGCGLLFLHKRAG